jgi:hypothetical protein
LVLAVGISLGVAYTLYRVLITPSTFGIDFEIYRAAAADLHAGQEVYGRSPVGIADYTFRYPIVLLAAFSLYLLVPPVVGFAVHVAGTVLVSVALGLAIATVIERHGIALSTLDRVLICLFILISPVGAPSVVLGNINHHIALALGVGLIWLERGRQTRAGIALGIAAVPKVFPAAIGIWLIVRRKYRAMFAAIATGLGALGAGAVLFGWERTRRYFFAELIPRSTATAGSGTLSPSSLYVTLQRPLTVVFADASGTVLMALSLVIVAPAVAYTYLNSDGELQRLVTLLTTLCAILLVIPSYTMYFVILSYPLIPLLYLLSDLPGRVFGVGVVLMQFTVKLGDVTMLIRRLWLPDWATTSLIDSSRALYTVGTPVLWGTIVVLVAGCWQINRN